MSFDWATPVPTPDPIPGYVTFRNLINKKKIVCIQILERDPKWPIGRKDEWPEDQPWAAVAVMESGPNIILFACHTVDDAIDFAESFVGYEVGR